MWQETKDGLYKQFEFADFKEAFAFMQRVAAIAEERQHHPRWKNDWNKLQIWLISHDKGNVVTQADRDMATAIDALVNTPRQRK